AGKSTLLRVIATQWQPSGGSGCVLGFDLEKERREIRRRIGAVFHECFLRPEFTLLENLRFAADLYRVPVDAGVEWAESLGLGHRLKDRTRTFSEGMTKRASLARSLVHKPALWLLDEPFAGLDPSGQEQLRGIVSDYVASGNTAIVVTHHLDLASDLASDVYEVNDGELSVVEEEGAVAIEEGD
ncbi:MAG: ABC transporter ATP-binding protein, partial [Planctomycetota bacterium]